MISASAAYIRSVRRCFAARLNPGVTAGQLDARCINHPPTEYPRVQHGDDVERRGHLRHGFTTEVRQSLVLFARQLDASLIRQSSRIEMRRLESAVAFSPSIATTAP